jgi:intracellular septation protein A
MSFQQNKYQVIKNAISYELANFCFNYFLLKRDAIKYMYDHNLIAENDMHGTWEDQSSKWSLFYICRSRNGNITS